MIDLPILDQDYEPYEERDHRSAVAVAAFLQEHGVDAFKRSNLSGHLTASGFVVSEDFTHTLLLHHRKLECWLQPGGHCDGNPDTLAVARTELWEETGLTSLHLVSPVIFDIDMHTIPQSSRDPEHLHFDIRYLFIADRSEPLRANHESTDAKWIEIEALEDYSDKPSIMITRKALEWRTDLTSIVKSQSRTK